MAWSPEELRKEHGFPERTELGGTWPVREETIPLHGVKVICRIAGVSRATLEPGGIPLPLAARADGVGATVPRVDLHAMVVFE